MRLALVAKLECSIFTPHPLYKSPYLVLKVKHLFWMFGRKRGTLLTLQIDTFCYQGYEGVQGTRDGEEIYSRIMRFIYYIGCNTLLYVRTWNTVCHAMTIGSWFGSDLQLPSVGHQTAFVAMYDFSLSLLLWALLPAMTPSSASQRGTRAGNLERRSGISETVSSLMLHLWELTCAISIPLPRHVLVGEIQDQKMILWVTIASVA